MIRFPACCVMSTIVSNSFMIDFVVFPRSDRFMMSILLPLQMYKSPPRIMYGCLSAVVSVLNQISTSVPQSVKYQTFRAFTVPSKSLEGVMSTVAVPAVPVDAPPYRLTTFHPFTAGSSLSIGHAGVVTVIVTVPVVAPIRFMATLIFLFASTAKDVDKSAVSPVVCSAQFAVIVHPVPTVHPVFPSAKFGLVISWLDQSKTLVRSTRSIASVVIPIAYFP